MQRWKIILAGVTGDLAKRKILPALAEFAQKNEEKVQIDLIGYSRSKPVESEILQLLTHPSEDKIFLNQVSFVQGDYNQKHFFDYLNLNQEEVDKVLVYLATPPSVYLEFLKNISVYKDWPFEIIMEKPFGQNPAEAKKIIRLIQVEQMDAKVKFFDHYLFKNSSSLSRAEQQNLVEIKSKKLKEIHVEALESVDVKGRGGFYDSTGALQDMLPAHLYSLSKLGLSLLEVSPVQSIASFKPVEVVLAQYESYAKDVGIFNSKTNTYFEVVGELRQQKHKIKIVLRSGKKLGVKKTQVTLFFDDGSRLEWNLDPLKRLSYVNTDGGLELNLTRAGYMDHTNLLTAVLDESDQKFLDVEDVLHGWKMYEKIVRFTQDKGLKVQTYADGKYPVEFTA